MQAVISILICLCLINGSIGCASWKPVNLPEHEVADDEENIGRVVITLKNGDELELWSAIARADSVIGYTIDVRREKSIRAYKTELGP